MNREKSVSLVSMVVLVVGLLVLLPAMVAAEPAAVVRETILRAEPGNQAGKVGVLQAEMAVELLERQGGWYLVKHDGVVGWVPLLSVRKGSGDLPTKKKSSGLQGLLSTYRTGSSGVTVATGVRGLDAVDLENSKPDMEELARINQFLSSDASARAYAAQAGLVTRKVDWIQVDGKER